MHSNDFEGALDAFLDRREYDKAANALYSMIRIAFKAGWLAAGGQAPTSQKLYEIIRPNIKEETLDDIETDISANCQTINL